MDTPYLSQQPIDDFGLRPPTLIYNAALAATTDTTFTVPDVATRYKLLIKTSPTGIVWVAFNATAAAPAGTTIIAATSELLTGSVPICREVRAGDVVHVFTATATTPVDFVLWTILQNN